MFLSFCSEVKDGFVIDVFVGKMTHYSLFRNWTQNVLLLSCPVPKKNVPVPKKGIGIKKNGLGSNKDDNRP